MSATPSAITIVAITAATAVSALVTHLVLRSHTTIGLDNPDERRKKHAAPVPRLGGLPIFLTLACGFIFAAFRDPTYLARWWPVMLTCTLIFVVGFIDDVRPLGARVKLLGQLSASCILYGLGVSIDELTNPFGDAHLYLGLYSFPVTILWLIAIPNIINLIDGMDGLATGFGLFLCITLGFVGHVNGRPEVVFIAAIMTGALAGFLIFNYPPARIFLGDGGAYLIGFFIAATSLVSAQKGSIMAALLVMIVALGVPILDTFFAIARRALRGVPIFRADAEHIHHRLMMLGFSKTRALIALYSVSVALSLIGIGVFIGRGLALPIAGAALFLLALGAARYLGYVKSWSLLRGQVQAAMERRRDMLFTHACGRVAEFEAERCATREEFVKELRHCLDRVSLQIENSENTEPLPLQLEQGVLCRLYHAKGSTQDHERWLAKADAFAPALSCAVERWGLLPSLEMRVQDDGHDPRQAFPTDNVA
jgi:UDP-GlcNAc:undecaprenyl-phosphate GlcNAc-1-phosphate transferase